MSLTLAQSGPALAATAETVNAETLGRQLHAILPPLRLHSMSLYNAEGDVLWLSEGALGPDEHSVVLDAIQTLHGETRKGYHETGLEDGRFAMFLPVRAPKGDLVGMVMLLTELKALPDGTMEQLASARVRGMLQKIAVFLRVGSTRAGETTPSPVISSLSITGASTTLSEAKVEEILTLELEEDAPAAAAPAPQQSPPQAKASVATPAPAPPEPTVQVETPAQVAADLTLSVQELVKMRSSGRTRRYEVLARSKRDAARNEVPAAFVARSAAGADGAALDGHVARQLIDWLRGHPEVWDGEPASFSMNLSIGALEDPRFLETIGAAMASAGIPANSMGFEITEFAGVQCKQATQRFIGACERMGCFVVIDNFTFDSAVLPLLGSSAVRMVKIDPKLTSAAMKEKLSQALVIAISQACKVLGVHCIAKNVETPTALEWLEAIGCDFAQGYALEKPLSLESLAAPPPTLPRGRGRDGKGRK